MSDARFSMAVDTASSDELLLVNLLGLQAAGVFVSLGSCHFPKEWNCSDVDMLEYKYKRARQ